MDTCIAETYAGRSTAQLKNSLYDSYLRAFRWATDRIGDQGVVAFVSNGGWIDGNTGDGVRLSMAEDFTDLYVFNLRGNQRTAGEQSRREGGKVFGSGSRNTVAITIGVKNPAKQGFRLYYRDIGDYLSADEKLSIVKNSTVANIDWQPITPNEYGDWVNQRDPNFEKWPVLGEKRGSSITFFKVFSRGLATSRDSWCYDFSSDAIRSNVRRMADHYNSEVERLTGMVENGVLEGDARDYIDFDSTKFSWDRVNKRNVVRGVTVTIVNSGFRTSLYRPFTRQKAYFDPTQQLNNCTYQLPSMFPTPKHRNIGFATVSPGETAGLSLIATNLLPDLHLIATSQFFPRFTWVAVDADDDGLFGGGAVAAQDGETSEYGEVGEVLEGYVRIDNVTDEIKKIYRDALGSDITGDDIFHFVYGKLHDPAYRETYAADLKRMLPHIKTPDTRAEFDKFAVVGKELMALHVGYEDLEPWPLDIRVRDGVDAADRETWRVVKMRWAKRKDPETGKNVNDVTKLIYNKQVTVASIPEEADEYLLGSRSAVAWLIDRYQVKKDKASGIVNDPNDWADEVGNPRYIVDLIGKVTRVAMETVRIVESL